jgi:hypothetical protein
MAQTLKFGNGTWATKKGSTLSYNDENNNYKPLPFTTTRNSIATRVNKEGLIEVVGNDVPRIDYTDSAEGVLLLENSATNKFIYSEDFTQWSSLNLTVTSDYAISPSGKQDASFITPSSGSNEHKIELVPSTQTNSQETFSVYAKPNGFDWLYLRTNINGSWSSGYANFNITTGETDLLGSGFTSSSIEDAGNGWYRCSVTFSNRGNDPLQIFSMPTSQSSSVSNGDGINGALIYAAQAELGNLSSYIPTNGSTVTRAAETANGSGNSEVFNDSEGVLFADIAALANDSSLRTITLGDNSSSNAVSFRYDNPNQITLYLNSGGVSQFSTAANVQTLSFNKCLIKYKANDFSAWVNGFKIGVDTSGIIFPSGTLDRLNFDIGYNSVSPFHGKTKEIGYYDTALTDAELEYMTSYRSLNELVTVLNLNEL